MNVRRLMRDQPNPSIYIDLFLAGVTASNLTAASGGSINISGHVVASNTVLDVGTLALQSVKATLVRLTDVLRHRHTGRDRQHQCGLRRPGGHLGFTGGDIGDITSATSVGAAVSAPLSSITSGGNTYETVIAGTVSDTFIFAGHRSAGPLCLEATATAAKR